MHKDRSGHKALASDLTEEWRPIIADSLAMSLINGKELHRTDFVRNEDGVFLKQYAMKEYIEKYRERMDNCNNMKSIRSRNTYDSNWINWDILRRKLINKGFVGDH